ncbi:V-type proton ATPase 116 kDa subunit a 1-like [Schistocerca serialis cubense]|uniref:V-type proton ATPase 116 kDa subunit a 1-like n=1 Tax=Schistocerca serialis cubense TaxID=2023355 RepID=UPI00214E99C8|nr:V-type proton ATPase 116 kDa subunit a 1-like [Schistocerca serialis cubense]
MGAMFRSEKMALCQLFIQPEAAYASVSELGELGIAQFRDLNHDVNVMLRKFVNEVRLCDELERKLRFFEAEIIKDEVPIPDVEDNPKAPNPRELVDLEAKFEQTENELRELSQNAVNLKQNFLELTELKNVLDKAEGFFKNLEVANASDLQTRALMQDEPDSGNPDKGSLGFVAGVVPKAKVPGFERMLWRISHGNVFLRQADLEEPLEEPKTGNMVQKTVFVAFFQGEQLRLRVKKVCTGFHAALYSCPTVAEERADMLSGVRTRLQDLTVVLNQTKDHRQRALQSVAKELNRWIMMVRKMKAIYHTLNGFNMDVTSRCLIAECWVPVNDLPRMTQALQDGGVASGSSVASFLNIIETSDTPPTYVRTNKFTAGFQTLIDSYGSITYQEVNPGLFTIITFPFLFAIMFGDSGHGLILFAFGLYMILTEKQHLKKKITNEIWGIFFAGRYIIVLMGIFSVYTGLIYNDIFSKSINIFGSNWKVSYNSSTLRSNDELQLNPATDYGDNIYPLGMDPAWQLAEANKIMFLNSFKMKLSIIFGFFHMGFGVILGVVNHIHFRKPINILLETVPQFLFLLLLFGYLVSLMFAKWILYGAKNDELLTSEHCAPNVLITFINMLLFKESDALCNSEGEDCCDPYFFNNQRMVQAVMVLVALLCIPWLLLAKPIYIIRSQKKNRQKVPSSENIEGNGTIEMEHRDEEAGPVTSSEGNHDDHEGGETSDIFIYQGIHTIEYILGTISHTASYLRLWALSLAHSQLSEVLWSKIFHMALGMDLGYGGGVLIYLIFWAWSFLTLSILVLMEGLSAFLHTLRLHWVEFMSKFYTGTGYLFTPFSFKSILEQEDNEAP